MNLHEDKRQYKSPAVLRLIASQSMGKVDNRYIVRRMLSANRSILSTYSHFL